MEKGHIRNIYDCDVETSRGSQGLGALGERKC